MVHESPPDGTEWDDEPIVMVCISDYAGQVRGKGFPVADLDRRLRSGIGLAPTNLMINAFGAIGDTPWGSRGELVMLPESGTETRIPAAGAFAAERFFLADLLELDGTSWECCPRAWVRRGLDALQDEFGLRLLAAFEHEFRYEAADGRTGDAYLLDAMRLQGRFAGRLVQTLRANRMEPESFLPEFGPAQYEVTVAPRVGIAAADDAVRLREITRAVARRHGSRACFAPVTAPGAVGNGVHVHFSLRDEDDRPVGLDVGADNGIAERAGHFVEGILSSMPSLVALTAPSPVSYERLQPNRWSATYDNVGLADREAGIRVVPTSSVGGDDPAAAFNFEYRAADAAASPYLVLGALAWAGLDGLRARRPLRPLTDRDPGVMSDAERARLGLERLPGSLDQALDRLEASEVLGAAMRSAFHSAYLRHKRSELDLVNDLAPAELVDLYVAAY